MSATYNWAYRPNVLNKYGFVIPDSPDDVRPDGYPIYVALFGNDLTGNGSRLHPFRTLGHAMSFPNPDIIIGSGVYREGDFILSGNGSYIVGDGDVEISLILFNILGQGYGAESAKYYNIKFTGTGTQGISDGVNEMLLMDCIIDGVNPSTSSDYRWRGGLNLPAISNTIFINVSTFFFTNDTSTQTFKNNTFYNCNVYFDPNISNYPYGYIMDSIFDNCNIHFTTLPTYMDFCVFNNCNFRLENVIESRPIQRYPIIPTGYVNYTNLSDLQDAFLVAFGANNVFSSSLFSDPQFNNKEIGDYTLQINSPAKNLNYFGSYVGARSIGTPLKASTDSILSGFDEDSNVNLDISEDSITLIDNTQNAQIDSKVIPNLIQREISKFPSYGFNADRNGEYIDSIPDMDSSTIQPSIILTHPSSYIVELSSIEYNGQSYQAGERFTTATASTTFTSSTNGVIREIIEAPQRHTIMARFSNGDGSALHNGDNLITNNWYYVSLGPVNYATQDRPVGTVFKAVGSFEGFTGLGTVTLAMDDTISYQHYEPGIKPTSNNVNDSRTDQILRGNGDPNYVRGGLNITEFPVNAKFVQIRYQIKVNNLKP